MYLWHLGIEESEHAEMSRSCTTHAHTNPPVLPTLELMSTQWPHPCMGNCLAPLVSSEDLPTPAHILCSQHGFLTIGNVFQITQTRLPKKSVNLCASYCKLPSHHIFLLYSACVHQASQNHTLQMSESVQVQHLCLFSHMIFACLTHALHSYKTTLTPGISKHAH